MWKDPPTRASVVRWGLIVLLVASVLAYLRFVPPSSPWSPRGIIGAIMPPPKVVEKIVTVEVPGPERIRIVPKEKIVEVYRDLPTPVTVADNASVVTAIAAIPPSPQGGTAISVLHTGQDNVAVGHIEYKPTPQKFFELKKEFGVRAGAGTGGLFLGELYWRPLRIGPIDVEARGFAQSTDRNGADFGGALLVDYRF